jgi:predicted MPP superfamily phosphohydrolase
MTFAKGKKIAARSAEVLAALLALLLIAAGISAFMCSRVIKVTQYDVELDGITDHVKLVVVSDIHGKIFGEDNEPLCELVAAQEPDAIVLLGDLFPSDFQEADAAYVLHLTEQMQRIAPVYFAMGNHEKSYTARYGDAWIEEIKDTGATVFDESWADLELCGNTIRIGGSMGHGYLFGRTIEEFEVSSDYQILTDMQESPYPAILLAHWPDTVALSDGPRRWKIDLVLCGHTHGGVVRVPGIGGVYAPLQGWWPKYDYGEFQLNAQMRMIITSGLSGHDKVPRIFNLPEICVINLH